MENNFIPTLGNMIKECESIIKTIPPGLRNDYAKLFQGTEIEKLILGGCDNHILSKNCWCNPRVVRVEK